MTLYEFNALKLNERMEAVNQYGTFLDNYITKDIKINCKDTERPFIFIQRYYKSLCEPSQNPGLAVCLQLHK